MKDLKEDFEKRAASLKEEVRKNRMENGEDNDFKRQTINEKICPFMSTPEADRACTPQCKHYRTNKKGYECPISELSCISYNLNSLLKYFLRYLKN